MSVAAASFGLTLAWYLVARWVHARVARPITNPVVTATPLLIGTLLLADIDYGAYMRGAGAIKDVLGPATVALALPLYRHRAILRRYAAAATLGIVAGGAVAAVASVVMAYWLGVDPSLHRALAIKSATSPIAAQIGPLIASDPGLCAVFAIATGMTGAVLGPYLLNALHVHDPVARGLAYGTVSHGIGTAQAAAEGELQGAVSGVAMGCAALLVSLAAPRLLWLL